MNSLIAFLITITLLLVALIKFKVNPSVGLFVAALLMGILSGIPMNDLLGHIGKGFGNTMASLGLLILFGGIFGEMLGLSGATEEMAKGLLRKVGKKNDLLALNLAGFIVSIPVYFASGYIMLSPLMNALQKFTKKRMAAYAAALTTGLLLTHCIVAPTPGPVAVAMQIGANLGWFILYGIIVALPASLLCGWQYGNFIARKKVSVQKAEVKAGVKADAKAEARADAQAILSDTELLKPDPANPSAATAFLLILFPIALIVLGAVFPMILPEGNLIRMVFTFLGNNNVALFLAMIVTSIVLHKNLVSADSPSVMKLFDTAADKLGSILMVIGTGGCFGLVLQASGLGDALVALLSSWNMPVIALAFILAMIIRAAVGSATVAMLTTVSIVGPAAVSLGYSPLIIGLAICSGTVGLTLPTDGAFWLPTRYNGLTVNEAFEATTYNTTLASAVAFGMVLLLNALSGVLPGMF